MTLVIALANVDQIIQVSDRRLSWNSQLKDDSSNKVGHAVCDDASFLYSFTGLAKWGSHLTSRWLLDALYGATQKGRGYSNIAEALAEQATDYFQSSSALRNIPPGDSRLTIMLTGYTANGLIVSSRISNFQDFLNHIDYPQAKRKFTNHTEVSTYSTAENPTLIQVIGRWAHLRKGMKLRFDKCLFNVFRQKDFVRKLSQLCKRLRIVQTVTTRLEKKLIALDCQVLPQTSLL